MEEKISVHENPTLSKKLSSFALAAIVILIGIFLASFLGLLVGAFAAIPIIYWGWGWIGSKTTATIITAAGRVITPRGKLVFVYGVIAGNIAAEIGRSNVFLCKEGVVLKHFIITMLYPWNRIKEFAANPNTRKVWLNFGFGYYANRPLIQVGENYSEVERILSEHIANRVTV